MGNNQTDPSQVHQVCTKLSRWLPALGGRNTEGRRISSIPATDSEEYLELFQLVRMPSTRLTGASQVPPTIACQSCVMAHGVP